MSLNEAVNAMNAEIERQQKVKGPSSSTVNQTENISRHQAYYSNASKHCGHSKGKNWFRGLW